MRTLNPPSSKYHGVNFHSNRWYASISKGLVKYNLGSFTTEEAAARAYDQKAKELHGSKAKLNFPAEQT